MRWSSEGFSLPRRHSCRRLPCNESETAAKLLRPAVLLLLAAAAAAQSLTPVDPALETIARTRWPQQAAISPDGSRVAIVEAVAPGKSEIAIQGARFGPG